MIYQKARARTLDEMVGNNLTIGALKRMLKQSPENRPHAVLLYGPTGCGKTTVARILAREFGCSDEGIIELNAANTRGIDTIREIASHACLYPILGKAKTYILDESGQLTRPAQEALLKVIEDTPKHCYFILCTTEPQNIIQTVRNRCMEFEFSLLCSSGISEVLENACKMLELSVKKEIIEAVSYICDGSPRAALVSLEKVMGVEDIDEAIELLFKGTEEDSSISELCRLLMMAPEVRQREWKRIIDIFSHIDEDTEKVRRSILNWMWNGLNQYKDVEDVKDVSKLMNIFSVSTFYGGKAHLGALVVKAIFMGDKE